MAKARDDAGVTGDGDGNPNVYSKDDFVAAVIDTGIDASHQDLDGGKVIGWNDFVNGLPNPYDDNDHGTMSPRRSPAPATRGRTGCTAARRTTARSSA